MKVKTSIIIIVCIFLISCSMIPPQIKNAPKRRQDYMANHPYLSDKVKKAIINADILLGMTEGQVIASRGRPYDINRTTGEWGVHEQWVMFFRSPSMWDPKQREYAYIYFENGKVTSWQSW